MTGYSLKEIMAIQAAKFIQDGDIVFCGTGISMLAAMAAKHISAPESVIFFETGAIDSKLEEIPLAVGDPRAMFRTSVNGGLADAFAFMQNPFTGPHIIAILGAAQIDRYGNLNSMVIGPYENPKIRFAGNGGASDVMSFVGRTLIFMQHEKRKFVEKLDYVSSPGWLSGGNSRTKEGLSRGGPLAVITNLGVMEFDPETHEMVLAGYYPGISLDQISRNTGFDLDVSDAKEIPHPSIEELRILREVCDPHGLIIGS
ncbi:MAG: ketoacid-CoA transferase [Proteobacteria bacterium]|nr:ketoacid-CoA transferase [Pseudomonadota bacterium]MBU4471588.1 ketoacid-CoA transferase [Pseudomonadota bacterium]MCG2752594.1 ketoacid-CoA transferase [Desulfobacteraceae bacterium]